jgi:serine/threonine protein kinase
MEFVDGVNLRELLQQKTITSAQSLAIVPKICEALQFAHEQGIVHRDIKPENILLDRRGQVKIADFGIAKILNPNVPATYLTGAQERIGTPHYMAPEQVESSKTVDHRADIYSLGVVFYELLTGELPLGRFAPPSQKVQIDVRLDEVVLRALEKEPALRYQHASEVKTRVDTIVATPNTTTQTKRSASKRWPWIAATITLGLSAIGATLLLVKGPGLAPFATGEAVALEHARPVVVHTWPVSGATEIEPGVLEVSVTFSKPMTPDSYTLNQTWPGSLPESLDAPRFSADHRTCVLRISAKPGKIYGYMLNTGGRYNNFKDEAGAPALPYLLTFSTKPVTTATPPPKIYGGK